MKTSYQRYGAYSSLSCYYQAGGHFLMFMLLEGLQFIHAFNGIINLCQYASASFFRATRMMIPMQGMS